MEGRSIYRILFCITVGAGITACGGAAQSASGGSNAPVVSNASVATIAPDTVSVVTDTGPLVNPKSPVDGRLRLPDGYMYTVQKITKQHSVGAVGGQQSAPSGSSIYIVTVVSNSTPSSQTTQGTTSNTTSQLQATIGLGTTQVPSTDLSSMMSGQEMTFAVAVPNGVNPTLQLSADGYSSQFSLGSGKRIGTDIAVLYRSTTYPITNAIGASWSIPFTWLAQGTNSLWVGPVGEGNSGAITMAVTSAVLAYGLSSSPAVVASTPDKALLFVHGTTGVGGGIGDGGWGIQPVPTTAITLTLPDGQVFNAQRSNVDTSDDLWGGGFYFEVPASFVSGTLSMTPGSVGSVNTSGNAPVWAMTGTYTAPITMP